MRPHGGHLGGPGRSTAPGQAGFGAASSNVKFDPPPPLGAHMALTWLRPESLDDDSWRRSAACRTSDPDLFFPVGTTGLAVDHIRAAKAVCEACPAQAACLEFALETNQDSGVWGGASEEERRVMRRQRRRARRTA